MKADGVGEIEKEEKEEDEEDAFFIEPPKDDSTGSRTRRLEF